MFSILHVSGQALVPLTPPMLESRSSCGGKGFARLRNRGLWHTVMSAIRESYYMGRIKNEKENLVTLITKTRCTMRRPEYPKN